MRPRMAFVAVLALAAATTLAATTLATAQEGPPPMGGPGGRHHMGGPGGPGGHGGMGGPGGPGGFGGPMFDRNLYPPEMVLSNQEALGLTDEQITAIKKLLNDTHARTLDIHVDLERATERLNHAVEPAKVDEAAALAAADQAMALETQVKRAHLALMIRIKNLLTDDQKAKLDEMRAARRPDPRNEPAPQP